MDNQLIQIYLLVCQTYDKQCSLKYQRCSNFKPKFSDEEIITVYLFRQLNEKFNGRQIYRFIKAYWLDWFPALPSYQASNRRLNLLANNFELLMPIKSRRRKLFQRRKNAVTKLLQVFASRMNAFSNG